MNIASFSSKKESFYKVRGKHEIFETGLGVGGPSVGKHSV